MDEPAVAPNKRIWRLECEADCELWFHTEVSNVGCPGWLGPLPPGYADLPHQASAR
jgi:hypothetical protein